MHLIKEREGDRQKTEYQQKGTDFSAAQAVVTFRAEEKTNTQIETRANTKDVIHSSRRVLAAAQVVLPMKYEKAKTVAIDDPNERREEIKVYSNEKISNRKETPTQAQCVVGEDIRSDQEERSLIKEGWLVNSNQIQASSPENISVKEEISHKKNQFTTKQEYTRILKTSMEETVGSHWQQYKSKRMMDYDAFEELNLVGAPDCDQDKNGNNIALLIKDWLRNYRPSHQRKKFFANCKLDGEIGRWIPFIFEKHEKNKNKPLPRNDIVAYPILFVGNHTHMQSHSTSESLQWLLRCRQLDLRIELNDDLDEPGITQVFPDSRLTFDLDIDVFPRPLTVDHLVVHILNKLFEIRQAENMTVIHDRSPGSTFERSANVVEGEDYMVTRPINVSLQQRLQRCTLSDTHRNRRVTLYEKPAQHFKITDVAIQTLLKHQGILGMDTAVIQNGTLKMFLENFDALLEDVNGPWGDIDILQMVFRLLEAVENLHKNDIALLDINDKTLVLKDASDPTTVAIWNFSSAQFESNNPLDFNDTAPNYCPPEWWHIQQLREYSPILKKVDSWQIGCLLMKLLFQGDPPMVHLIPMRHDEQFIENHLTDENIGVSRRLIENELTHRIAGRVVHPHLKKIVVGLLEPCPIKRMCVEEALAVLRQSSDVPYGIII